MSYQTQAAGPYPVNCLLWLCHGFTGITAIDDVFLPVPLFICRLPYSFCCLPLLWLSMVFAIAPAVNGLLLPCFLNRGLLPLPLAFAILSACLFSCRDDALHWAWLPVLSTPWLIPTLLQSMPREV
jgi:hypothetical protein